MLPNSSSASKDSASPHQRQSALKLINQYRERNAKQTDFGINIMVVLLGMVFAVIPLIFIGLAAYRILAQFLASEEGEEDTLWPYIFRAIASTAWLMICTLFVRYNKYFWAEYWHPEDYRDFRRTQARCGADILTVQDIKSTTTEIGKIIDEYQSYSTALYLTDKKNQKSIYGFVLFFLIVSITWGERSSRYKNFNNFKSHTAIFYFPVLLQLAAAFLYNAQEIFKQHQHAWKQQQEHKKTFDQLKILFNKIDAAHQLEELFIKAGKLAAKEDAELLPRDSMVFNSFKFTLTDAQVESHLIAIIENFFPLGVVRQLSDCTGHVTVGAAMDYTRLPIARKMLACIINSTNNLNNYLIKLKDDFETALDGHQLKKKKRSRRSQYLQNLEWQYLISRGDDGDTITFYLNLAPLLYSAKPHAIKFANLLIQFYKAIYPNLTFNEHNDLLTTSPLSIDKPFKENERAHPNEKLTQLKFNIRQLLVPAQSPSQDEKSEEFDSTDATDNLSDTTSNISMQTFDSASSDNTSSTHSVDSVSTNTSIALGSSMPYAEIDEKHPTFEFRRSFCTPTIFAQFLCAGGFFKPPNKFNIPDHLYASIPMNQRHLLFKYKDQNGRDRPEHVIFWLTIKDKDIPQYVKADFFIRVQKAVKDNGVTKKYQNINNQISLYTVRIAGKDFGDMNIHAFEWERFAEQQEDGSSIIWTIHCLSRFEDKVHQKYPQDTQRFVKK